jgi:hypothetical protein
MYLKWTYFCNPHMGAISHWESCRQNILRFVSMSAITNYSCQIYENVDIMFIEIYRIH